MILLSLTGKYLILAGAIIFVILIVVIICVISNNKKNKAIINNSPYYKKMLELNSEFSFKKLPEKYKKNLYSLKSKKQFVDFNYEKKCVEFIKEYSKEFLNIVNSIEFNIASQKEYLKMYNSLEKTIDIILADKFNMRLSEFNKREFKLASKLLVSPVTTYNVTIKASYVSPKGQNSYANEKTFDYDFIKKTTYSLCPKQIFDAELIEEKNKSLSSLERLD